VVDLSRIAEQRLREAVKKGELDDLPGRGRPLPAAEDGAVPPELRMAYKILRNHGLVPREVALLRQIDDARQRFEGAADAEARQQELRQLEALCLEYNTLRARHADLEATSLHRDDDQG
jgi:hypothetical protein